MSWDTEILTMVRYMINDYDSTNYTYSDDNLLNIILISSQYIQQENNFTLDYAVNLDNQTISPDPTSKASNSRDESFLWLVTLKSCCMILKSELKSVSGQAIYVKDGESAVDLRSTLQGKIAAAKRFCDDYEDARWKHNLGSRPSGEGIFGPFSILTPSLYGASGGWKFYSMRDRPMFN